MGAKRQLCSFFLDQLLLAVPIENVQEMIRSQDMTRVPLAPESVRGLINLRGQILTTIDLRSRLGLDDYAGEQSQMNIVLRIDDEAVALLVDRIGDVLEVDQDMFEPPPETLDPAIRTLIDGAYKLQDRLLLVLNTKNAVDVSASESGG